MTDSENPSKPTHIGYILDGNRRWAKQHSLPAYEGHLAGYNALKDIIIATVNAGVKFVSLYAFSTENWSRDKDEVDRLMGLALRMAKNDIKDLIKEEIKVVYLGSRVGLSEQLVLAIEEAEEKTKSLTRGTACICFNYGGQDEIVEAVRDIVTDKYEPEAITKELIEDHLYKPEVPPVDLVVRTSGEQRLSNFMLWRVAYAELLFLNKFWPEMTSADVDAILKEYERRQRRFGA